MSEGFPELSGVRLELPKSPPLIWWWMVQAREMPWHRSMDDTQGDAVPMSDSQLLLPASS